MTAKELRCTVSALAPNPQGLQLEVANDKVNEVFLKPNQQEYLLTWLGSSLRASLLQKHPQTFWIECRTEQVDGREVFFITRVHYTRSPMSARLLDLIEQGIITLDHIIGYKRQNQRFVLSKKGPSWKIHHEDFGSLFPKVITFDLPLDKASLDEYSLG